MSSFPWKFLRVFRRTRGCLSTLTGRTRCRVWGVDLGPGSRFSGPFRIRRCPGSSISIGSSFRADGDRFENPVGLPMPCLVQTLTDSAELRIGDDVGMSGAVISCTERITIGDRVLVGANVRIFDSDFHPVVSATARRYDRTGIRRSPVNIGDDCWLGAGAVLLPGTTLGSNVVVAAGAVVKGEFGDDCIIGGVPAKQIGSSGSD